MKWFRFYSEVLDDPKVQRLSPGLFKIWVNILCVASDYDGALPPVEEIAYRVRLRTDRCQKYVSSLTESGLIDVSADGLAIHNWGRRQYKSDDSAPRVAKLRAVTVTPPDNRVQRTDTEQNRTEAAAARGKIFECYENTIGLVTPAVADVLSAAEREYPEEWIVAAFKEAAANKGRSWRYVEAILQRWERDGPADDAPLKMEDVWQRESKRADELIRLHNSR